MTGSLEEDRKRATRRHIAQGNAQLVIGTHALIEEKVEFAKLGLIVVDEQHRFGVMQRWRLMRKPSDNSPADSQQQLPTQMKPDSKDKRRSTSGVTSPDDPITRSPDIYEPDVLVMTATPIPRTLALTLYGDLDVSIIDELPPGRTPITTRSISDERAPEVWDFVRKQVALGRQAYV
ncbi:MAG: ATP-dependent DNA helicase RecG, partial [Acidobacteria bacterium]